MRGGGVLRGPFVVSASSIDLRSPPAAWHTCGGMETENVYGVELLAATGPIHGIGSPPGGDWITGDDLDAMVESYTALRGEIKAPVKLGHNLSQGPLGEFLGTDGAPSAGWVENVRRVGDRVIGDLMAVPKTIAQLMRVGAYRGRSVEFFRTYTSQADGKKYRMVLTGLALLGAHLPAVGGLMDWAKLYGSRRAVETFLASEEDVVVLYTPRQAVALGMVSDAYLQLADADREWDADEVRGRLEAWAGDAEGEDAKSRLRSAYLWRETADDGTETYRFPIADVVDGELLAVPAAIFEAAAELDGDTDLPAEDVLRLQQILGDYYWRMERTPPWSDYQPPAPGMIDDDWYRRRREPEQEDHTVDLAELRALYGLPDDATEEQVKEAAKRSLATAAAVRDQAKAFGLGDDADLTAVVGKATEAGQEAGRKSVEEDGTRRFTADEARKLEEDAAAGRAASEQLRQDREDRFVRRLLEQELIDPAQVDEVRADFKANEELVVRQYSRVKVPEGGKQREFGTGDRGPGETGQGGSTAEDKAGDDRAYSALVGGKA